MADLEGYVTIYESSDGGSGDPRDIIWQFFVGPEPVNTKNPYIAETMRLAISTNSQVRVTHDPNNRTLSQARIRFKYICEALKIRVCKPDEPEPVEEEICETRRLAPCDPNKIPEEPPEEPKG